MARLSHREEPQAIYAKGRMLFVCLGWDLRACISQRSTLENVTVPRLKYLGPAPLPGASFSSMLPLRESPW